MKKVLIIDFDSTFIKTESLEELANISLSKNPQKNQILFKIKEITNKGMNGEISFDKSLDLRIKLLQSNKKDIKEVIKKLENEVTPSFLKNKEFIKKNSQNIYIISGGFTEIIFPIVNKFNIEKEHIMANSFIFKDNKDIVGVDKKNLLSQEKGKVKAVKKLNIKNEIIIVGDGYTDLEVKLNNTNCKFVYFSENVFREKVANNADYVAKNFQDVINYINKI